ncbi:MFS general substrate transporter [Punctularia strigosozonata HHB-11173 SS5]|uniref:MFS general substrate transporter n=1 Tax=Punctularia strigosozonata (strain HHB-11173) TaxID=741275 RepID=UPI00044169EC|nr:MFS general substrate transporter [Punctularia strigosozonata HHB-11173 SS5]EIN08118.1 MFS general substrate transporter [Punctularia strigosozonata HHB-11173 SS5]
MSSENSPLLANPEVQGLDPHEAVYNRFSATQKRAIVALICWTGLVPMFVSGSFVTSIPQIVKDLDSTGPVVSLAISLSIFTYAFGCLLWATYSTFYGRRPIFLASLPLMAAGSLGVGLARSVPELMVWRVIQALGASPGMSVGGAVIGDIYKLEERGSAMGLYFGACLLGPAIAPLTGGTFAHYASWRHMQYTLFFSALLTAVLVSLFLPETSHPGTRGIEKALEAEGIHAVSGLAPGEVAKERRWKWYWLNPFSSLNLLRSPNLLAITIVGTTTLLTDFVLLIPMAYTIGRRYNITNEALIGACFIPDGIGNIIGAPLSGHISDQIIKRWRKRRGGEWVPEDRLRAAVFGAMVLVPGSILSSGLIMAYVDGIPGIVLNLVMLFANGIGVDLVLTPCASYMVDVVHSRSAEIMAANSAVRSLILSGATTLILPSIETIGVAWTDTIAALLAWVGFGLLWCTIRYGDKMRAWVDVGYSTAQTN